MTRNSKGQLQSTTVCGRRFCPKCGKWRHLLYFRPRRRNGKEYPNSPCDGCHNRLQKKDRKTMMGNRRARRQEYERIHKEALRRRKGVPPRPLLIRECAPSGEFKDVSVALPWIEKYLAGRSDLWFEGTTGVSARSLYRWRTGDAKTVRAGVLDQVLTRLGHPEMLAVLYD